MHDGSVLRFRTVPPGYDPKDRQRVMAYLQERQSKGEVVTGVLYVDETIPDMHEMSNTPEIPLTEVPYEKLCPGADALTSCRKNIVKTNAPSSPASSLNTPPLIPSPVQ